MQSDCALPLSLLDSMESAGARTCGSGTGPHLRSS